MKVRLAQRELALACVAVLAAACVLAVNASTRSSKKPAPAVAEGSYTALVGSAGPAALGRRTACGITIEAETVGIAHPTLPCGTRIYLVFHGKHILTTVIDRGPYEAGRQFDVTDALARKLHLGGVQDVSWSYAAAR